MKLIENWEDVLRKAWSVKFNVLAAFLAAAEVAMPILQQGFEPLQLVPAGTLAALAGLISGGSIIARVLAQKELNGGSK